MKSSPFTKSEESVISAMYQLGRWATAYEITDWANLSYPTTKSVLIRLRRKKIVQSKIINGKQNWLIIE